MDNFHALLEMVTLIFNFRNMSCWCTIHPKRFTSIWNSKFFFWIFILKYWTLYLEYSIAGLEQWTTFKAFSQEDVSHSPWTLLEDFADFSSINLAFFMDFGEWVHHRHIRPGGDGCFSKTSKWVQAQQKNSTSQRLKGKDKKMPELPETGLPV